MSTAALLFWISGLICYAISQFLVFTGYFLLEQKRIDTARSAHNDAQGWKKHGDMFITAGIFLIIIDLLLYIYVYYIL